MTLSQALEEAARLRRDGRQAAIWVPETWDPRAAPAGAMPSDYCLVRQNSEGWLMVMRVRAGSVRLIGDCSDLAKLRLLVAQQCQCPLVSGWHPVLSAEDWQ